MNSGYLAGAVYSPYQTIGICSICGGEVKVFSGPWYGVFPPTPQCSKCGATPKVVRKSLPTIDMEPVKMFATVRSSTEEHVPLKDGDGGSNPPESTNSTEVKCPYCEGTGYRRFTPLSGGDCPTCNGKGTIPALLCNDCNLSILNCKC